MAVAEQRRRPVITGTEAASLAIRTLPIENSSSLIDALMASLICRYVARWLALCDIPRLSSPLRRQWTGRRPLIPVVRHSLWSTVGCKVTRWALNYFRCISPACLYYTLLVEKACHSTFVYNFANVVRFLKILSLLDFGLSIQFVKKSLQYSPPHLKHAAIHYRAKLKCSDSVVFPVFADGVRRRVEVGMNGPDTCWSLGENQW